MQPVAVSLRLGESRKRFCLSHNQQYWFRLHLEKDEEKQALLDDQLAKSIVKNRNDSFNAFLRNIPSLLHATKC